MECTKSRSWSRSAGRSRWVETMKQIKCLRVEKTMFRFITFGKSTKRSEWNGIERFTHLYSARLLVSNERLCWVCYLRFAWAVYQPLATNVFLRWRRGLHFNFRLGSSWVFDQRIWISLQVTFGLINGFRLIGKTLQFDCKSLIETLKFHSNCKTETER